MIVASVIFNIPRVIAHDGKNKPQKLSGYGHQGLHFEHAAAQHSLISLVHDPIGFHCIDRRKKQPWLLASVSMISNKEHSARIYCLLSTSVLVFEFISEINIYQEILLSI